MSGLFITTRSPEFNRFFIESVQPDTPSAEAGLEAGDEIITINGRPASEFALFEIMKLFQQPDTSVEFTITKDGEPQTITIRLRRLV